MFAVASAGFPYMLARETRQTRQHRLPGRATAGRQAQLLHVFGALALPCRHRLPCYGSAVDMLALWKVLLLVKLPAEVQLMSLMPNTEHCNGAVTMQLDDTEPASLPYAVLKTLQ